uniref:Uncharacterized protein n=1 Tax=Rhizophora mucronata TaxID=61149 RepID=A0A2P2LWP4_RHIMU
MIFSTFASRHECERIMSTCRLFTGRKRPSLCLSRGQWVPACSLIQD